MTSSTPLTGRLLDYEYALVVHDDALREHLRTVLFDSLADVRSPERIEIRDTGEDLFDVVPNGEVERGAVRSRSVVGQLVWMLNRRSTVRRPGSPGEHEVMIHAGAVEFDGAGVLLVGQSGSGKTTASVGVALHGFSFLTDDIVAVDRSGAVRGSRKPIGLRSGAMAALGVGAPHTSSPFSSGSSLPVAASSIGVRYADTARVEVVLFPDQRGSTGELRPISRAAALQRLTGNCFEPVPLGRPDFEALANLVRSATPFEWTHGPLGDLANALRDLLGKH